MTESMKESFFGVFGPADEAATVARATDSTRAKDAVRPIRWQGPHGFVDGFNCDGASIKNRGDNWLGWFVGDLPGMRGVPWESIVDAIVREDPSMLHALNGSYAILLVHEATGRVWAVSDRRAQQPFFSYSTERCVYVSTMASDFCRLPDPPAFDTGWLYETIYFNHPVLETSFLEGVSRAQPATILSWQPGEGGFSRKSWASPFSRPQELVAGDDAARLELATFEGIAKDYFDDDSRTAVALTAGFDSRSVLASAPRKSDLLTYTYGRPGCVDLKDAAAIAEGLGVRHLGIELADRFVKSLPELMVATVRDSDGLERVLRAELLAVYPLLAEMSRNICIGGVSGDHIFRDHLNGFGNVPHIISPAMMGYIHGRGDGLEGRRHAALFGESCNDFRDHVDACLKRLNKRHGDVRRPEGYQRYLVYESAPKHFGGEAAVASNYVVFRSFFWDPRMVELSFKTNRATLGLSERFPKKDYFAESTAQAGVIAAGVHYGGGRIHGVRASTWAGNSRAAFILERLVARGSRFISNGFQRPKHADFLCWPAWLAGSARPLCKELLGTNARLREYIDGRFLDSFEPASDLPLASRLLTAELVIRLLQEHWPSSFQVNGADCDAGP